MIVVSDLGYRVVNPRRTDRQRGGVMPVGHGGCDAVAKAHVPYLIRGAIEVINSIRMNVFRVGDSAVSVFFLVFRDGASSSDAHLLSLEFLQVALELVEHLAQRHALDCVFGLDQNHLVGF